MHRTACRDRANMRQGGLALTIRQAMTALSLRLVAVAGAALTLGLAGCSSAPDAAPPAQTTIAPTEMASNGKPFAVWLADFRREAQAKGISARTLDAALTGVQPIPRVIQLDRRQPEGTQSVDQYLAKVVAKGKIDGGRQRLIKHRALLTEISARYHVQPQYILALWSVETGFGNYAGDFSVVASLATLAHEGRRAAFFRGELLDALRILDQGHITPAAMKGSWAGAMGQCQFMPSSFLKYAVDYDGDGRRDIWSSTPDVLASIANYLSQVGWRGGESWGQEVRLPAGFERSLIGTDQPPRPLSAWRQVGVTGLDGVPLANIATTASLIQPSGPTGRAFLVQDNWRAVMKWNKSTPFALSVGLIADAIAAGEGN